MALVVIAGGAWRAGLLPARDRGGTSRTSTRVEAVLAALDRAAAADLWPDYDPRLTPILLYDGQRTWLARHPSPPPEFVAVKGARELRAMPGRHAAVNSNTSITFAGVATATVMADGAASPEELARLAAHEIFHVFERSRHPDWVANEADLFTYPVEDAAALAGRRLEWEALRRALDAGDDPRAACWAGVAAAARGDRFARLGDAAAAYERGNELNEGLATYVEERAARALGGDGSRPAPLDPAEFAADQFRARTYRSGAALGRLLDRLAPGWTMRLEAGPTRPLDAILTEALAARAPAAGAATPCVFAETETAAARTRATADVAAIGAERATRLREFLDRPGYVIVVETAEGTLQAKGFDPLNATPVGGGQVLHERYLELGSPFGEVSILDRPALTVGAGAHPLFPGVRRLMITGLPGRPEVTHDAEGVGIAAPGVTMHFRRTSARDDGTTLFVHVGAPEVGGDAAAAPGAPENSLTQVGDPVPEFSVTGMEGAPIASTTLQGKVAIVMFWATWCPACRAELPRVEKDLWRRFDSPQLAFLAIARGQNAGDVRPFREQNRYTMPMALDLEKSAYAKFATQGIPRLYVASPEGKILFQMVGFDEKRFAEAQAIVERETAALRARGGAPGTP
jgi:thiol-disulfide isomerase/thioredoxin